MDIKKLSNQKGITGVDVVIAITIISITTIAILALYVNIIVGSKKVTRTSAATRIATSILENVDSMYYAEVEQELDRLSKKAGVVQGDYSTSATYDMVIKSNLQETVFNTKLNSGYDLELVVNEISSSSDTDKYVPIIECPLILEIKAIVKYDVSNTKQEVALKTIKKRELLEECNAPNINDLLGREFTITVDGNTEKRKIESVNQIQPIKWSYNTESYVKTNASNEWYSYLNKEWARVVITGVVLNEDQKTVKAVFDTNTDSVLNIIDQTIFVWIPRFGITNNAEKETAFTYGSSNHRISQLSMKVGRIKNSSKYESEFYFNGIATYDYENSSLVGKENLAVTNFSEGKTGVWVNITGGTINYDNVITNEFEKYLDTTINKSNYGPPITRIGNENKKYY